RVQIEPSSTSGSGQAGRRSRGGRRRLTSWAWGALCLALAAVAYRGLLGLRPDRAPHADVANWFFEPSDTSPLLVLGLALWLAFRRWGRLRQLPARGGHPAVSALLLASALLAFAWALRSQAPDLQALSLLLLALGAAHLLAGAGGVRAALLPALFLVFCIPLPAPLLNHVVWAFQLWTAEFAGALLSAIGLPAVVSGDQILLPDSVFAVIETCSGLRSVETLTMLALLMADLFRRHGAHTLLLLAAAPPIAFAINGVRAAALVVNPHSDIATVHDLQGVAMLLAGVVLLYAWDGALERLGISRGGAGARVGNATAEGSPPVARRLAVVTLLLACAAALSLWLPPWPMEPVERPALEDAIEQQLGGWRAREHIETDWMFMGNTAFGRSLHRRYVRNAEQVELFVGTWDHDRRFQSAFSPKTALPGSGWLVEGQSTIRLGGREVEARVLRKDARRLLAVHWYEEASGLGVETLRALLALDRGPLRRPYTPVVVRLATPFSGAPEELRAVEARLADFAAALEPGVKKLFSPGGAKP
ncbi:MAG TPA: EpsI family protein, partial [Myxococcota bacterium]